MLNAQYSSGTSEHQLATATQSCTDRLHSTVLHTTVPAGACLISLRPTHHASTSILCTYAHPQLTHLNRHRHQALVPTAPLLQVPLGVRCPTIRPPFVNAHRCPHEARSNRSCAALLQAAPCTHPRSPGVEGVSVAGELAVNRRVLQKLHATAPWQRLAARRYELAVATQALAHHGLENTGDTHAQRVTFAYVACLVTQKRGLFPC